MIILNNQIYIVIQLLIFFVSKIRCDIVVKNNENTMKNLYKTINQNQVQGDVKLIFNEKFYNISTATNNSFDVQRSISFYSEKGTIFDFQHSYASKFTFNFKHDVNNVKIKFHNITFYDFVGDNYNSLLYFIITIVNHNTYEIEFNNCKFIQDKGVLLNISYFSKVVTQSSPQVIFNNCSFINSHHMFEAYNSSYPQQASSGRSRFFLMHFKNCLFKNIDFLGTLFLGNITFENCTFENVIGAEKGACSIFCSYDYGNTIKLLNTRFENINIEYNVQPFYFGNTIFDVYNTTFKNFHSYTGYLFFSHMNMETTEITMTIDNSEFNDISTLFGGQENKITIKNSRFHNINGKVTEIPIIFNSAFSEIKFLNTKFENISSSKETLFNIETSYTFTNAEFKDIKMSSKSMIETIYKNISFDGCTFKNILCIGENNDASLIEFTSSDYGNTLSMNNVSIEKCNTNGDFIAIDGNNSNINISNIKINEINSYGSLLNNKSTKSVLRMNEANISNNKNTNKSRCGLITYLNNDIDCYISNSIFKNNEIKNNGGSFCFKNWNDINLKISSSVFEDNYAFYGGALYLYQENNSLEDGSNSNSNSNNNNNNFEITDSIFQNNNANYYGGALFINSDSINLNNLKNDTFIGNKAYAGGAIYTNINNINNNENNNIELQFKSNKVNFNNNMSESHGSNYASNPLMINTVLSTTNKNRNEIKSGETYSLSFNMTDAYGHVVTDTSKYYNNFMLHLSNKNDEDLNEDFELTDNNCIFSNGKCELNKLKIYAKNSKAINIKLTLESHVKNDIIIENDNFNIMINDCDKTQIKMYYKDSYFYCENPICDADCPVSNGTAICVKNEDVQTNNKNKGKCECVPGWIGDKCETKDYANIETNYTYVVTLPIIILIASIMIFFAFNYKKGIIMDTGHIKCQFFLLGLMLYFLSINFNKFLNYKHCALNFILRHSGVLLTYIVSLLYVTSGFKIGMYFREIERLNYSFFKSGTSSLNYEENISDSKGSLMKTSSTEKGSTPTLDNKIPHLKKSTPSVKSDENREKEKFNKNLNYVHSLYVELTALYIFVIISLIVISIFYYDKNKEYIHEYDGKWRYKCPLEKFDMIACIIEFMSLIYMIVLVIKVWNYTYIFKCIKYISYSAILWLSIGPLVNVISYVAFYTKGSLYNCFNYILNGLCYLIMLALFSWDKIYYIMKKKDNDPESYFLSLKLIQCPIHRSLMCGCKNFVKSEVDVVTRYIEFYKYSSKVLLFSNGRLTYVKRNNKTSIRFNLFEN